MVPLPPPPAFALEDSGGPNREGQRPIWRGAGAALATDGDGDIAEDLNRVIVELDIDLRRALKQTAIALLDLFPSSSDAAQWIVH